MTRKETESIQHLAKQWQTTMQKLSTCCVDKEAKLAELVDLSRMEVRLLSLIFEHDGMLPSDAAHELGLVRSRITRLADGLTEKGLLTCASKSTDGRCRFLAVTARGKRIIERIHDHESQFHVAMLLELPGEMRTQTLNELQIILETMQTVKSKYLHSTKQQNETTAIG